MAMGGPSWPNLQCLVRRKPATSSSAGWAEDADRGGVQRLAKTLSVPHLVAIGVGSTIGAGIYVLVGTVAREHTGPGLTLSFLIAGVAAALSALCYAELSCRFPSAGSAYHYSYICIGESVAWLIGWALILEYTIGGSSVARGMSPNLALFFGGQDKLPFFLAQVHVKGLDTPVDPCAAILVLIVTALLCLGIRESSSVEGIITTANIIVMLFVICAGGWLGFRNGWVGYKVPEGYFPNGVSGVLSGSATLFFAFIGFDTVASTAEEVKNPRRDLPLGMGLTLSLCCFLYMMVSAVVVGLVPYHAMDPDTPISSVFARYGMQWAEYVVSSGAVLALVASLIGGILPQDGCIYTYDNETPLEVVAPDDDERLYPDLVDRWDQLDFKSYDALPTQFEETDEKENEENIENGVKDHEEDEDRPLIEYDRDNPSLKEGSTFPSMIDCRNALATYCIRGEYDFVIDKSELERLTVHCSFSRCKWRMHASTMRNSTIIQVKINPFPHTCPSTEKKRHKR